MTNPPSGDYSTQTKIHGWGETQYFGPSTLASEPALYGYPHFHTGMDVGEKSGTELHTTEGAQVLYAGYDNIGYGNRVVLEMADSVTGGNVIETYDHLSQIDVKTGQHLDPFDTIGKSGATGNVTGPHLHWEVLFPQAADPSSPYKVGKIPDTNVTGYVYEDPAKVDPTGASWDTTGNIADNPIQNFFGHNFSNTAAGAAAVGNTVADAVKALGDTIGKGLLLFGMIVLGALILGVGIYSSAKSSE